jgi:O-antigen/teichoic acid export membrane protein
LGAFGILSSLGLAWGLVLITGNLFILRLYRRYRPIPVIRKQIVNDIAHFSFGNYIANILGALPTYILPLIIIAVLTTESSAYFYIPFALIGILGTATEGATFSLLAEGSHKPARLRSQTIKAVKFISLFLVPGIVIMFVFGDPILSIFGVDYAQNSLTLLRLFTFSCIPWAIINLYTTIVRVQMRVKPLIYLWAFFAVFTIVVSYWLMKWLGLIGVGIAWLSAQSILAMVTGVLILKMARISLKSILEVLLKRVK